MKTTLKIIASFLLTGFFLWAAFQGVDWLVLKNTFLTADPTWILVSGLLALLSCLPRAWRWQMLLKPVSPHISLKSAFWAVVLAYAGNNVLPRAGEFARVLALKKEHPISMSAVLATVVVERLLDMLVLLIFFAVVLVFAQEKIAHAFPGLESVGLISLPVLIIAFCGIGWLSASGERGLLLLQHYLNLLSPTMAQKTIEILRAFLQGIKAVHTVEGYVGILISTILLNAFYLLALFLPFYSFNFPSQYGLNLFDGLVVMVISTVGVVIPTPGGAGTYHYFCKQSLHLFYGIPESVALAFATSVHGIAFIFFSLFGGPSLLRLLWSQKKEKQEKP